MKALVLAAGFGTRLLPHTRHTPKPLFTINGKPLIDHIIRRLIAAGVEAVAVNTHHLHRQIETFVEQTDYPVPVTTKHEPDILGTGGAIRNLSDFWDDRPFWVVNSDIFTDIDLEAVAAFHHTHAHPATLALVDDPEFNTVHIDRENRVIGFKASAKTDTDNDARRLTFTGIQILTPEVLNYLPPSGAYSSIDAFRAMLKDGRTLAAWVDRSARWSDLGTPERYRRVAMEEMAGSFREHVGSPGQTPCKLFWEPVAGDGSDRKWFRVTAGEAAFVMADHGIRTTADTAEVDAFVAIGRHLAGRELPVPHIFAADTFSGLVLMEDLGRTSFEEQVNASASRASVTRMYQDVVDLLIRFSVEGGRGFDPAWTYQTASYDREVILQKECRYFIEAFVNGWLGIEVAFGDLEPEFNSLAERLLSPGLTGFMHRDFQSRNIMVKDSRYYIIDFQGGRLGPVTYDLASLLTDPYTDLDEGLKTELLEGFIKRYAPLSGLPPAVIREHYALCSLSRNLQMLGAFGFLTRVKGKLRFKASISPAIRNLKRHPLLKSNTMFPKLRILVDSLPGAGREPDI